MHLSINMKPEQLQITFALRHQLGLQAMHSTECIKLMYVAIECMHVCGITYNIIRDLIAQLRRLEDMVRNMHVAR